jgi:hypothetical protein
MSDEEQQGAGLVQGLGTSPKDMATLEIDRDILGVLDTKSLIFALWLREKAGPRDDDKATYQHPAYRHFYEGFMKLPISIKGRGRVDAIRGEAVMKGQPANVEQEVQKPNWAARNIYDRGWEQREKEKLGLEP